MRTVLCFGDSNVFGFDPRSYLGGRYPQNVRWTGLLASFGWHVVNLGQNGLQIPSMDWEFDFLFSDMNRFQPIRHFLVMLGGNDLLCHPSFSAEDVADRMDRFLQRLTDSFSGHRFCCWLIAPPPMIPGTWVMERRLLKESSRLPACYRNVADRRNVRFLNAAGWEIDLAYDGVHFSPDGHRAFADKLHRALSDACGQSASDHDELSS